MELLLRTNPAPGAPGAEPKWSRSDKNGVGTALSGSSLLWYTSAGGVVTEVYYPDVDTPQVRDIQFLVTDGATFFHDGMRNFVSTCTQIDPDALGLHLTNVAIGQPYTLELDVIAEPGSPCLLIRTHIDCTPDYLSKLRIYVLVAPHLEGHGAGNSAYIARTVNGDRLVAHRGNTWLAAGADRAFRTTSCGYVGVNDGWQDIVGNRRFPMWNFTSAENGNVALTGEIDLAGRSEFMLAVSFGQGDTQAPNSALVAMQEALSYPFDAAAPQYSHLQEFIAAWKKSAAGKFAPKPTATSDQAKLFNYSRAVLLAHEDKSFTGAIVASLGIPWGADAGDSDGGYHLVWPRDMCQSATALLAVGEIDVPLRALMYLATSQLPGGRFHQKFYVNGQPFPFAFDAQQLDEYSFPIMLAYRLKKAGALQFFQPRAMALAAAGALIADGPMTQQERWEENEGYSPSTLASNIAALVCAANFAAELPQDQPTADFLLDYADFLESHIETWTVTTQGSILPGVSRHYIRLLPTAVKGGNRNPQLPEDPNTASFYLANRDGPAVPARNIVDGGFLELVRYGIRKPGDPLIEDSLKVVDASLRDMLRGGPCWRRYTADGYGQRDDGTSYNQTGVGRPWPLLTGERGHYELAAGRDASPYIKAMEAFAGQRRLLTEQLWNAPDLPEASPPLFNGRPTGSAMPLAWAHAEYIRLVRSISDGKVFDLVDIVADRYLKPHAVSPTEIWNFDRQVPAITRGKRLRIPLAGAFKLRWSADGWATVNDVAATATSVGIYYADIPTGVATGGPLSFTLYWIADQRWEGVNYEVQLT